MNQKKLATVIARAATRRQKKLDLSKQGLAALPPEIGQLTSLTTLDLQSNQLTSLPPEIGELTSLTSLGLQENQLTSLPPEIGQLTSLTTLNLRDNQLTSLPPEIGRLTSLTTLDLQGNELTSLPPEIGRLTSLTTLDLWDNELISLPPEIGQITSLSSLDLWRNRLTSLPPEIGQLTSLKLLTLVGSQLTSLPPEIGRLTSLPILNLRENQLTSLPPEIGQLTSLTTLDLDGNRLTSLPPEIGRLTSLTTLDLQYNPLTSLPPEIGQLTALNSLVLKGNELTSPPPDILAQGTQAVLAFLRDQLKGGEERQWRSKLLLVGEGGVGKTSLLKRLRGEDFDEEEETTHGMRIETLTLPHPELDGVTLELKCWDFGGQQIYHATHQFFLTDRSLFLLLWNARLEYGQGRLHYWLDTIQANAPNSPVLLVATHIDQRTADLPFADLRRSYPQIRGWCAVSNREGTGIEELRAKLIETALELPMMGETTPRRWLEAADAVRAREERQISPEELSGVLAAHGIEEQSRRALTRSLHDLGDILFFQDQEGLNDVVILKPQWVTEHISRVLESPAVAGRTGIFTQKDMVKLWPDLDAGMRAYMLRLMEQFDLSYRTLENKEISLVVEHLSLDEADYHDKWQAAERQTGATSIRLKYQLSTLPPGIPTWFIARTHRFTTHTHWRSGALFAKDEARRHVGLVRAFAHDGSIELEVRGPFPQEFFSLLKDGLEVTLARYPGLKIERRIPCPGHGKGPCPHEFDYDGLWQRLDRRPDKPTIECPESMEDVDVRLLLFGLHPSTNNEYVEGVRQIQEQNDQTQALLRDVIGHVRRGFLIAHRRDQGAIEAICPSVFALRPLGGSKWKKTLAGQKIELHLYCEAPEQWHPIAGAGPYVIDDPAGWIRAMGPALRGLVAVMKYGAPLVAPGLGVVMADYTKTFAADFKLMEELVKKLPDLEPYKGDYSRAGKKDPSGIERKEGADLRKFYSFLNEQDPDRHWAGLEQVYTPEGHRLWLCGEHAKQYRG